jgi:hypothetical protein
MSHGCMAQERYSPARTTGMGPPKACAFNSSVRGKSPQVPVTKKLWLNCAGRVVSFMRLRRKKMVTHRRKHTPPVTMVAAAVIAVVAVAAVAA